MSDMERNRGILRPMGSVDSFKAYFELEHLDDYDFTDYLIDNNYMVIDGEVYNIYYTIKADKDMFFVNVNKNSTGEITFHTLHYNGGACLEEIIRDELERQKKNHKEIDNDF